MRNVHNISVDDLRLIQQQQQPSSTSQSSPNSDNQSSKPIFSLSSNILSPTSTIPTDIHLNSTKHSLLNDNEINNLNGHITDSNESENISSSNDNNNNNQLLSMQPFLVESDDDLYKDLFVPCMVYLPCRHRVTKPLEISLRLKPSIIQQLQILIKLYIYMKSFEAHVQICFILLLLSNICVLN